MKFDLQPKCIKNDIITIIPLEEYYIEILFEVVSNSLVWEQDPNINRYQ